MKNNIINNIPQHLQDQEVDQVGNDHYIKIPLQSYRVKQFTIKISIKNLIKKTYLKTKSLKPLDACFSLQAERCVACRIR